MQYFHADDFTQAANYYLLFKHHQRKEHKALAMYYLKRAEKLAERSGSPNLLEVIYSEFISLSHGKEGINPHHYITQRMLNRKLITKIQEVEDTLAVMHYEVSKGNAGLAKSIKQTTEDLLADEEIASVPFLTERLCSLSGRIIKATGNYKVLEKLLKKVLKSIEKRKDLDVVLFPELLSEYVKALIVNEKWDKAEKQLDKLKGFLEEKAIRNPELLASYYNLKADTFAKVNPEKSYDALMDAGRDKHLEKQPELSAKLRLKLIAIKIGHNESTHARKLLFDLRSEPSYFDLPDYLQVKAKILEVILLFEKGLFKDAHTLLIAIQKAHEDVLRSVPKLKEEAQFVRILSNVLKDGSRLKKTDQKTLKDIQKGERSLIFLTGIVNQVISDYA